MLTLPRFARPDRYGPLNSHDLIKAAAIILMIGDHLGYYFFPDQLWIRWLGRFAFPLFFFLIGYTGSTKLSPALWLAAGAVIATDLLLSLPPFPLNIVVTVILTRIYFRMESRYGSHERSPLTSIFLLTVWLIPTAILTEYGTFGILMALCGRYIATGQATARETAPAIAVILLLFAAFTSITLAFPLIYAATFCLALAGLSILLSYYRLYALTNTPPIWLHRSIRLCARHSLAVYAIHLILIKLIYVWFVADPSTPYLWLRV